MYGSTGQYTPTANKFTGKERDSESGLDNFGARYFGSSMGRFMSPDPLAGHTEDPQTLNRYVYVRNNPLNLTDPTGLDFNLQCAKQSDTCQKDSNLSARNDDDDHGCEWEHNLCIHGDGCDECFAPRPEQRH